ncbi:hypothetical protein Tco_1017223 [Tanacetum coccineum]|uniref:Uncharacterized protein n=1 Tax=Tanacetum coccineum TaxID=301880 RepID=A0ABQ5FQV8_9ASTR
MNLIATQQAALDNALVPPDRLKIKRCNARIAFSKPQREETYQVTLDVLKLSSCYPAFLITAEVPQIYMHQFWNTITKIKDTNTASSWIRRNVELILKSFGMYNKKNVDYVALLWEDFMYQADNGEISSARKEHMPYPRFTKVIINHFISTDKTISMRNMINLHTICDDLLLDTLKFVSKTQDYQQYGALIPDDMINQDIKDSQAYKTYYDFATRKVPPRKTRKYKKVASPLRKLSPVKEAELVKNTKRVKRPAKKSTTVPTVGVAIRDTPGVSALKKKAPAKANRSKGIEILSDVALSKVAQLKEATKRSKKDYHISQASGSGDGTDFESGVLDEQQRKTSGTDEKIESLKQSSSVSFDFASKFLILENVPPSVDEVASMMNVKSRQEESSTQAPSLFNVPVTAIPETTTAYATTIPPTISMITPLPQLTTPSPAPITVPTTTSIPALLNFSSLFGFDQRVSTLETELSQLKQADHSAQLLESVKSQLPTMVDDLLSIRIGYATRTTLESYTKELEKKA